MIGQKLRAWRLKKGLSVYEVAKKVGVTPSAISNWESGIRHPHRRFWKKLITLTNGEITIDDFFTAETEESEETTPAGTGV